MSRDELHQSLEAVVDGRLGQRRVDEARWSTFTELLALERERHLDDAGDVTWRRLDANGVRRYQLCEAKKNQGVYAEI